MPDFDDILRTSVQTGTFYGTTQAQEDAYYAYFADEAVLVPPRTRPRLLDSFAGLLRRWAT